MDVPGISFQYPLILFSLPPLLMLIGWARWTAASYFTSWRTFCLLATGVSLALSAAGPVLHVTGGGEHRVLLVDVSDSSTPDLRTLRDLLDWARSGTGRVRRLSVFLFGRDGVWVAYRKQPGSVSLSRTQYRSVRRELETDATRPGEAVSAVQEAVRERETTRFLLASDGQFDPGSLDRIVDVANRNGKTIDTLQTRQTTRSDLRIQSVAAPSTIRKSAPFRVSTTLVSTGRFTGRLVLKNPDDPGSDPVERRVSMSAGERRTFRFQLSPGEDSIQSWNITIQTDQEEWTTENNRRTITVRRSGVVRVCWYGDRSLYDPFVSALRTADREVDLTRHPDEPRAYDLFVLAGPSAGVSDAWESGVKQDVLHGGKGLVMIGHPRTFAAGGWEGTPVEDVLPVHVFPPDSFSMSFVLDVSGSMGQSVPGDDETTRLEVLRGAILRSLTMLRPADRVALISFAEKPRTVVPLRRLGEATRVQSSLSSLTPGGGTHLAPAVQTGIDQLQDQSESTSYLIVFSDAKLDEPRQPLVRAAENARNNGIRILVVTTGRTGERPLLDLLTRNGSNGRVIYLSDIQKLRETLRQELKRIRRLVHEDPEPVRRTEQNLSGLLPEDANLLPQRTGSFHRVTPRPAAVTLLRTPGGDVTFAAWKPGKGRSVAIPPMMPVSGELPQSVRASWARLLRRSVQWVTPESTEDWSVRYRLTRRDLILHAKHQGGQPNREGLTRVRSRGRLTQENTGDPLLRAEGEQVGRRRIRFRMNRPEEGAYVFSARVNSTELDERIRIPLDVPVSREYLYPEPRSDTLRRMARRTGGTHVKTTERPPPPLSRSERRRGGRVELMRFFLMGAGLFLLLIAGNLLFIPLTEARTG